MPIRSAARRLAGPPLSPGEHHETRSHQAPPEAKPAEEFLKWPLGFASHGYTGRELKVWECGILGFKVAPCPLRHLPKGAGKSEGLCLAGAVPGSCWVSFMPTLRSVTG